MLTEPSITNSEVRTPAEPRPDTTALASGARPVPAGPVFLAFILAAVLGLVGSVAVVLVVAAMRPGDTGWSTIGGDPGLILLSILPMELSLAAMAFLMVRRSGRGRWAELGLVNPKLSMKSWLLLIVGSGTPFAGAAALATITPNIVDPDAVVHLWRNITPSDTVLLVLAVGAMPGHAEEIFFRGFAQRRLARAWSPPAAIAVSSLLFALLHVDPSTMALALVLGLWLGFIAWRTGSTWPGIAIFRDDTRGSCVPAPGTAVMAPLAAVLLVPRRRR